jgi:hypothetical protein
MTNGGLQPLWLPMQQSGKQNVPPFGGTPDAAPFIVAAASIDTVWKPTPRPSVVELPSRAMRSALEKLIDQPAPAPIQPASYFAQRFGGAGKTAQECIATGNPF